MYWDSGVQFHGLGPGVIVITIATLHFSHAVLQ